MVTRRRVVCRCTVTTNLLRGRSACSQCTVVRAQHFISTIKHSARATMSLLISDPTNWHGVRRRTSSLCQEVQTYFTASLVGPHATKVLSSNFTLHYSGVVMGADGRPPRAALFKGRQIESCQKIMLCKRNKIRLFLVTIYFITATEYRRPQMWSKLVCDD